MPAFSKNTVHPLFDFSDIGQHFYSMPAFSANTVQYYIEKIKYNIINTNTVQYIHYFSNIGYQYCTILVY